MPRIAEAVARLYAVKRRPADHPGHRALRHSPTSAFAWAREVPESREAGRAILAGAADADPQALVRRRRTSSPAGRTPSACACPRIPIAQQLLKHSAAASPRRRRIASASCRPPRAAHVRDDLGKRCRPGAGRRAERSRHRVDDRRSVGRQRRCCCGRGAISTRAAGSCARADVDRESRIVAASFRRPRAPLRAAHAGAPGAGPRAGQGDCAAEGKASRCSRSRGPTSASTYWLRMPRDPALTRRSSTRRCASSTAPAASEILVEAPPEAPEWAAVRDRLKRACG